MHEGDLHMRSDVTAYGPYVVLKYEIVMCLTLTDCIPVAAFIRCCGPAELPAHATHTATVCLL